MAAVFPVVGSGSFDTNPSYSGAFIPTLWSNKLNAKFYSSTMMTEIANTSWEGEIKNQGDTIRIRTALRTCRSTKASTSAYRSTIS